MQVLISVEGQTEEAFIKNCLAPYLIQFGIYMTPVVVSTKVVLSGLKTVGGLSSGNMVKFLGEIRKMLHSITPGGVVTSFIDFYAVPNNFPGFNLLTAQMSSMDKVKALETSLHEHYNFSSSFIPYIQLHEFEALLFSHSRGFESYFDPAKGNIDALLNIISEFDNPELINSAKATSPSHRILQHYPRYKKVLLGNMIILEIGIETVLAKCPRFRNWVEIIISKR